MFICMYIYSFLYIYSYVYVTLLCISVNRLFHTHCCYENAQNCNGAVLDVLELHSHSILFM